MDTNYKKLSKIQAGDKLYIFSSRHNLTSEIEIKEKTVTSASVVELNDGTYLRFELKEDNDDIDSILLSIDKDSDMCVQSGELNVFHISIEVISTHKEGVREAVLNKQDVIYCGIKNLKLH